MLPVDSGLVTESRQAPEGEDVAALIRRRLAEMGRSQRWLSDETGIAYSTLNHWVTRRRGTGGNIDSDDLRALAKGLQVAVAEVFTASGRRVPADLDQEREKKLLRLYRSLSTEGQRALISTAEVLGRSMKAS